MKLIFTIETPTGQQSGITDRQVDKIQKKLDEFLKGSADSALVLPGNVQCVADLDA